MNIFTGHGVVVFLKSVLAMLTQFKMRLIIVWNHIQGLHEYDQKNDEKSIQKVSSIVNHLCYV